MDVSKNGGTQQPWDFLLKMIILGCSGGTPIFGNTQMTDNILCFHTKALVSWKATHPAANASDFGQYWPQKDCFWNTFWIVGYFYRSCFLQTLLRFIIVRGSWGFFTEYYWLVVSTHLKNIIVNMGSSSPIFGMKIQKYLSCHHPDQHFQISKKTWNVESSFVVVATT